MRFVRVQTADGPRHARQIDEANVELLTDAPYAGGEPTGEVVVPGALLVPVVPTKIVCVGRSYRAHAEELGNAPPEEPLLFLKPPSALLPHEGTIRWPSLSARVDYEGEVAAVIGEGGSVFGITCANDVTARDIQRKDSQFTRGKGFDTFCPCGPWIETDHPPLDALRIRTRVDSELRQDARTDQLIWPIAAMLAYIGEVMTLLPGDLVLTGTPAGVAPLVRGQTVEVTIDGVGTLRNRIE